MSDYRDRLAEALAANAVITVAGTGVSKALSKNSPIADWAGLVRSGISRIQELDESAARWADAQEISLNLALEESDTSLLIGVAGQVVARLTQPNTQPYVDWLRDTVGSLKVREPALAKAIGALRTPILTTNYDLLLEDALNRRTVNWQDHEGMRELFRTNSEAIGHLHGDWKHAGSVVLGPEHYAKILADDPTQTLETAHYTSKSLLFIGYGAGLSDPNFSNLLHWHRKLFPESRGDHFRLCSQPEFASLTALHAQDDIRVIAYGQGHEDLPMFLESLRPDVSGKKAKTGLGRDAVAYAREAIVDQIRAETVIGDSLEDYEDRELSDITVNPVLLPMPHEQFVNARAYEGKFRPERINADAVYLDDKILVLAGEELSGVTTALRWIAANAAASRVRTAPIFVDARACRVSTRPLDRQIRDEAYRHGLITGKKDALPLHVLALDNLKPQTTKEYEGILSDLAMSTAPFIVIGCREGDEGQLIEDLQKLRQNIEIAYVGKLGRTEVAEFARILAPHRPSSICDSVLRVVRSERLPRTPFTVALLVVLLAQGSSTSTINNSETAVLEQYVSMLLGRSGPFLDPRHYLDPQNREVLLSQLAKEFVRRRRGAMTQSEAVTFIGDYFLSRDWTESANSALENFGRMRLLRVEGSIVQFQQTSYLHLFAAKAATKDPEFLRELLEDPLYFSPIIRHYAALVRDSEKVVLRMKQVLEGWTPEEIEGRFYGPVRTQEVADAPDSADDTEVRPSEDPSIDERHEDDGGKEPPHIEEIEEDYYDESSDADRIPFPLDDPSTWPATTRLAASLELSSRVLRDSDDLANLEVKSQVFRLVISRWGYLARLFEQERLFEDVAREITELFVREEVLDPENREHFEEFFALSLSGFAIYRSLISTLASRKLIRTYERVREETGVREDPYSALVLALFALSVRGAGWTDELISLADNHGQRWSTVQFVRGIARMAWESDVMTVQDTKNVREFIKRGYVSRYKFPNERTKKISLKQLDQKLTKERSNGLAKASQAKSIEGRAKEKD